MLQADCSRIPRTGSWERMLPVAVVSRTVVVARTVAAAVSHTVVVARRIVAVPVTRVVVQVAVMALHIPRRI